MATLLESIGQVEALFLGSAQDVSASGTGAWWDKPWRTGYYKQPQGGACWLGYEGFRGDEQADRRYHGGVDKAVCVYPVEHYVHWRQQNELQNLPHGAFGENLAASGLLEAEVCIGDVFALGSARVQVSQPRQPCWKLARRWRVKDLTAQVEQTGFTGFYFRVLQHGSITTGDAFMLLERPCPQWTIQRCNELMHHDQGNHDAARALAECPQLSGSWKDSLWARVQATAHRRSANARIEQP